MEEVTNLEIYHDLVASRFVAQLGFGEAYVAYRREGSVMDILSTQVPHQHRRLGIGEKLVTRALDHAQANGFTVVPTCSFVPVVIDAHPKYRELVAE